jgi:hypothetical protein
MRASSLTLLLELLATARADQGHAMQRMCPRDEYFVPFAALSEFALVGGAYDAIRVTYIHRRTMSECATQTKRQLSPTNCFARQR